MEKFGIFELLDTLAALTQPPAQSPAPTLNPPAPERKVPDDAFRAPDYGLPSAEVPRSDVQALDGLLAKHEKIKKKARGQ